MAQGQIRWKQTDYLSLGRAVANFNKKINELNKLEKKLYLPETKSYKDIKESIKTRSNLNSVISSLKAFSKPGMEDPVRIKTGDIITKWEQKELGKQIKVAKRNLEAEAKMLEIPLEFGFSRAQMGSAEYAKIQSNIKSLEKSAERISNYQKGKQKAEIHKLALEEIRRLKALEIKQSRRIY